MCLVPEWQRQQEKVIHCCSLVRQCKLVPCQWGKGCSQQTMPIAFHCPSDDQKANRQYLEPTALAAMTAAKRQSAALACLRDIGVGIWCAALEVVFSLSSEKGMRVSWGAKTPNNDNYCLSCNAPLFSYPGECSVAISINKYAPPCDG